MKSYWSFFKIRFVNSLQYRAVAFAGVLTQFAWGFLEILMFRAFYRVDPGAFPMEFSQLVSYIWLQQAFLAAFMIWARDPEIDNAVSSGNIAYELIRPVELYGMWFAKNAAWRLASALLRCFPVLIVSALLPPPFNLTFAAGGLQCVMFLITMVLGFIVTVASVMIVSAATLYIINGAGLRLVVMSLFDILSGAIVPIPFMPDKVRKVVELLPFASAQNVPLRIYSGSIAGNEIFIRTGIQLFWAAALIWAGWIMIHNALRRIVVQGG